MTPRLCVRADDLAEAAALRGYDAVHLAAAEALANEQFLLVTGDLDLAAAAQGLGLPTARLN